MNINTFQQSARARAADSTRVACAWRCSCSPLSLSLSIAFSGRKRDPNSRRTPRGKGGEGEGSKGTFPIFGNADGREDGLLTIQLTFPCSSRKRCETQLCADRVKIDKKRIKVKERSATSFPTRSTTRAHSRINSVFKMTALASTSNVSRARCSFDRRSRSEREKKRIKRKLKSR